MPIGFLCMHLVHSRLQVTALKIVKVNTTYAFSIPLYIATFYLLVIGTSTLPFSKALFLLQAFTLYYQGACYIFKIN